jgi:hypothetical protein
MTDRVRRVRWDRDQWAPWVLTLVVLLVLILANPA